MKSASRKRLAVVILSFLALFVTSWLELFLQRKQNLIGGGINRAFLFLFINVHVVVIVILLFIIIRKSIKLFIERRKEVLGSVFKRNLLFAFTFFSVIPSFFVFFTAGKLITTSIDDWFHTRISNGLSSALTLHEATTLRERSLIQKRGESIHTHIRSHELNGLTLYRWNSDSSSINTGIDDEVKIWRSYRKFNDRSMHSLREKFLTKIKTITENTPLIFDFYGSLYWIKKTNNQVTILVHRYPETIRYPLIEIQNSYDDYAQLKSMRNPIYLSYLFTFILVLLLILFLSIWCAFYLARGISAPIQELLYAIEKMRHGERNVQVSTNPTSDLNALAVGFNEMTKALNQAHTELEQKNAENLANIIKINTIKTWQEAAKQMAHEIKNPLTPIQLATQRLQRKYSQTLNNEEAFIDCTNIILDQVQIIKNLASHFSQFASMPSPTIEPTDLNTLIQEITALYAMSYPDISLSFASPDNIPTIHSDPKKIKQVIINLLDNSIRALHGLKQHKKYINITTSLIIQQEQVSIIINDNGPGIEKSVKETLFLPYISTSKKNMGLGLAIVHDIMAQLGGSIKLVSGTQGATFELRLPTRLK